MDKIYQTALKRYNSIVFSTGREHKSIGTEFSEGTDGWNLADMVEECIYQYRFRIDCMNETSGEERAEWRKERDMYARFIKRFMPQAENIQPACDHGVIYKCTD